ncbi:LysR family transcriptional regulator [Burkholderia cepacia]|uniref:LysR substrate-binding domain-containing protein n=1 Tax=Burkholderia cepacia TaxID=292 RepID=UPI0007560F95|nr:LysR substrate-binding domain-containing protein [Burkholderia cepacia]KVA52627.1 LysR family transcriptional regulator [Burkholderia cepacia]KVA54669.1 LysR family transcriptional regulator [Burkholderia cepacia]KVA56340.1 LysR family transcriptional regulator [Burkholderia cepacia]KVA87309.1 LysR family transcriptional regulator [Burkholderia cepacia]KVA91194.1 LysR family transcriptional regulator [Burkholderia cepacia]
MKTDMRCRLDGIAVFVEAVEAGGFARAAERLALSRFAVGKAIARLESRLGVRLFNRTTRTQNLTEDGQIYYERCRRAIEELRAAESLLESGKQELAGRLRVTMPVLFGRYCIAPILLEFAREHPKLELGLSLSDRPVDLIAEGFDMGIRNGALGEATGLCARPLATQPKVLCVAPAYLETRGKPESIEALVNHDVLIHWRIGRPYGHTWLPHWLVCDRIRSGELTVLWGDRPAASMDSHAIWPATDHMPLRVRLAIDTLVEKLPLAMGVQAPIVHPGWQAQQRVTAGSPSASRRRSAGR